jgi:hypothetical protein
VNEKLTATLKELEGEWAVYEKFRPQKQPNYIRGRVILRSLITLTLAVKQLCAERSNNA